MLKARMLTGLVLMSGFLLALFFLPDVHWALLMLFFIVMGAWEWGRLAGFPVKSQSFFVGVILAMGMLLLPDTWGGVLSAWRPHIVFWGMVVAALFWLLLVPWWLFARRKVAHKPVLALAGMLVLMPAWMALVYLRKTNPWLVLVVVMVVAIADSAAYFSGKAFGRHKLAPEISPGKTWEGVIGAVIAVALFGLVLCVVFHISLWLMVGLLILMALSVVGDLFESLLKRQAGLKDSGDVLPGHGGILDRIDGLTSTLPFAALCLHLPIYYTAFHE